MVQTPLSATFLGCAGTQLSQAEIALFQRINPVGFILFGRNIVAPEQVQQLTHALRSAVGWNCPILIDQEGGRVARLAAPHWGVFPPALDMAQCANPERAFWLRGRLIADQLSALGLDVNCAPVLDVASDDTHPILQNRCYGRGADQVIANATAFLQGQCAGGVLGVIKHIPGHGRAVVDSHLDLPVVDADITNLNQTDFRPFRALNHAPFGMTAHILFTGIDGRHPATLSPKIMQVIRHDIGFDGFLMTDDISMKALNMPLQTRVTAALNAGCDAILHCNGDFDEMTALCDIVPPLTVQAQTRLNRALAGRQAPEPVDIAALNRELTALLQ